MLALLIAGVIQTKILPDECTALWVRPGGEPVLIRDSKVQTFDGALHIEAKIVKQVPNGSYIGDWYGSPRLTPAMTLGGSQVLAFGPPQPSMTNSEDGELRVGEAVVVNGRIRAMRMLLTGRNGALWDETIVRCVPISTVSLEGHFADKQVDLTLHETAPKHSATGGSSKESDQDGFLADLKGEFIYRGQHLIVHGERFGMRASFEFIDTAYGNQVGTGYAEWTLDRKVGQSLVDGGKVKMDHIIFLIRAVGQDSSSSEEKILTRVKE